MSGEQKNSSGYGGARASNGFGMDQGARMGESGGSQFGQPPPMQFRGPSMINVFCYPGSYSVTTRFEGNLGRTFGGNVNPNNSRQVRFASDAGYSGPRNPSARMPRESTPYPRRETSPDTTASYEVSPTHFKP